MERERILGKFKMERNKIKNVSVCERESNREREVKVT